jgi:hypothetical protein
VYVILNIFTIFSSKTENVNKAPWDPKYLGCNGENNLKNNSQSNSCIICINHHIDIDTSIQIQVDLVALNTNQSNSQSINIDLVFYKQLLGIQNT